MAVDLTKAERGELYHWIDDRDGHVSIEGFVRKLRDVYSRKQTIPFLELAPELRNRIYEYAILVQKDINEALLVTSPSIDGLMTTARQPALTRASRQVRAETLAMFYAKSNFVAYINKFDFTPFIKWAQCISPRDSNHASESNVDRKLTAGHHIARVNVHVKLLDRLTCEEDIFRLVRDWTALNNHEAVHVKVHNLLIDPKKGRFAMVRRYDQRELVAQAMTLAERAKRESWQGEDALRAAFRDLVDRTVLGFLFHSDKYDS